MYFVLLGKTDMFVLVKLFDGSIERKACEAQAARRISATLDELNCWLVALCMGRINCHALCIVGVFLGDGGEFVFGMGDTVVKESRTDHHCCVAALVFV